MEYGIRAATTFPGLIQTARLYVFLAIMRISGGENQYSFSLVSSPRKHSYDSAILFDLPQSDENASTLNFFPRSNAMSYNRDTSEQPVVCCLHIPNRKNFLKEAQNAGG